MRIGTRLTSGFLLLTLLMGFIGYMGTNSVKSIQQNNQIELSERKLAALLDRSLVLTLQLIGTKNLSEYNRIKRGLEDMRKEFDLLEKEIKRSAYGFFEKISDLEKSTGKFTIISNRIISAHKEKLAQNKELDEKKALEKNLRHNAVRTPLNKLNNTALTLSVMSMEYHSKEAIYQYKDLQHVNAWLDSIQKTKSEIEQLKLQQDRKNSLLQNCTSYQFIAKRLGEIVIDQKKAEDNELLEVDKLTEIIKKLQLDKEKIISSIHVKNSSLANRALKILLIEIVIVLLITLFLGLYIARSISKPIVELRDLTLRISRGQWGEKIKLKSRDEIGQLAASFNQMTEDLQNSTTSIDSLNKEITERKKVEALIVHAKKEWEDTFDSISDIVTVHDLDFNILRANKAAESLFGLKFKELINSKCYKIYHKKDCPPEGCPSRSTLKTGKASTAGVYEPSLGIYVEIKTFPRFDEKKNLIGIVHIVRDITQHKKIEEDIIKAKDSLEKQARRLDEQLKEAIKSRETMVSMLDDNNEIRGELEKKLQELKQTQDMLVQSEKLASLGTLISDMAHEVNNPLMVISGRAQLSLMEDLKNKEVAENLNIIMNQCHRAKDIIQRLLIFSKPSKGELKEVDINNSLDFVNKLIEHQFSLSDIKIARNYSPSLPEINIDEKQMHEVFMNLLKNSAEAMPKGGTITVSTSKENGSIRIDFKDTGCGIPKDHLKKIFDPFFTTKESGTGLGLSVCYGIVKLHKGEIKYESEPGKWTIATILLPIKEGGVKHDT